MMSRDESDATLAMALEAYRSAAHAEADGHFDERALEAQRARVMARLELAGQRAKVLTFPGSAAGLRVSASSSRRWISVAAAAGLLIGLVTGQLLHVMPGDNWVHRDPVRSLGPAPRMAVVPAVATAGGEADDALLDAVDAAVRRRGVSELRALDDFTFVSEPY